MIPILFIVFVVVVALVGVYYCGVEAGKKIGKVETESKYKKKINVESREVAVD